MLNLVVKTFLLSFIFLMSFQCFGQKIIDQPSELGIKISSDTTIRIKENFRWCIDTIKYLSSNKKSFFVMLDDKKFSINEIKFPVWPKKKVVIYSLKDKIKIIGQEFKITEQYFPLLIDPPPDK
ncbi:MAG: hypothetical protein ACQES1_00575 [Bacteroidota bacterium]